MDSAIGRYGRRRKPSRLAMLGVPIVVTALASSFAGPTLASSPTADTSPAGESNGLFGGPHGESASYASVDVLELADDQRVAS